MLRTITFCTLVLLAILTVILLALFSPVNHKNPRKSPNKPLFAISLYIQQPQEPNGQNPVLQSNPGALVFHRKLTEGPENTSRVVGTAQGFIIPVEDFANSGFNIIYLTFNTDEYSGSLSVEAKKFSDGDGGKLAVLGGTGSFAFARGRAIFSQRDQENETYHVKLQLKYPDRSETIPG